MWLRILANMPSNASEIQNTLVVFSLSLFLRDKTWIAEGILNFNNSKI